MMKVIIMDDEAPVLRLLKHVLESFADVEIIGEYTNSLQGLQAIREQQPDICFLDVEMPDLNGFQVIQEVKDTKAQFVFVTAYDYYAVEAFRVDAADYILKPIFRDEVERVLNKLRPRIEPRKLEPKTSELVLEFFGDFQVLYKGSTLEWPTEKVADFFAYFVYHAEKKVEKWKLCDIFWPDLLPEKAMHNVYNAIYLLKRVLDAQQINYHISNKRGFYQFTIDNAQIDFETVDKLLQNFSERDEQTIEELEQIEALYQDEFLARKDYSWCQPIRAYYEQVYYKYVNQLLHYYVQNHMHNKAIVLGSKMLQLYPEQEQIALILMPLYLEQSKPALQKFYKEYSAHFMTELNVPLSLKTKMFYEKMISEQKLTR